MADPLTIDVTSRVIEVDDRSESVERRFLRRSFGMLLTDPMFTPAGSETLFVEGSPFQLRGSNHLDLVGRYRFGAGEMKTYDTVGDLARQLKWPAETMKQFLAEATNITNRR